MQLRRWARLGLVLVLLGGALVAGSAPAQADNPNGQTWPNTGSVTTYNSGNYYSVTFQFTLTTAQLGALRASGPYVELDFQIRNFDLPCGWDGYNVADTNLPGALHDVAFQDPCDKPNPAVTRIRTQNPGVPYPAGLQAGVSYYANLTWNATPKAGQTPYVVFVWTPSRWANMNDLYESTSCAGQSFGNNIYPEGDARNPNEAWCIFPVNNTWDVVLLGDRFFGGGWPSGQIPLWAGQYWYTFSPPTPPPGSGVGLAASFFGFAQLATTQQLVAGQYILSHNGLYCLIMQFDGNLVLYGPPFIPLWQSGTSGSSATHAVMQSDGNFVLYRSDNSSVWQSLTNGSGGTGISMQDDGNLVLYAGSTPKWQTSTGDHASPTPRGGYLLGAGQQMDINQYLQSPDGHITLLLQTDGNLVLYGPGYHVLWNAGSGGQNVTHAVMQSDGNLVLYRANNTVVWQSGTNGSNANRIVVQNDGNAVIYRADNSWVWQSGTGGQV